jgi:hypothetical protein
VNCSYRHALLAPLLAVLALLLGLTENASAAFNDAATEPHYGNFLLWESEASASEWLQPADPTKENGEWIYDGALGVPVYVRQNPWTKFDPLGLAEDRIDDDGFKWSDRDHHKIPRAVVRDAGWDKSAKEVFDNAKIETPNGHNFRAHGHYNREVAAEMGEFIAKNAPDGLGGMSARDQRALAEQFVDSISNTENKFIRGFNAEVKGGPKGVDKWFNKTGKDIVLKATGQAASKGGKIVTGIAKTVGVGGRLMKGVPIVGGLLVGGASLAQGKSVDDASIDVVMSVTGGDIAQEAIEGIARPATDAIEKRNQQMEDTLRELDDL